MSRRVSFICLLGLLIALFSFQNAAASDHKWQPGHVEDIEAIKQLKAEFSYVDDAEDIDAIMDLFTEDAVVDLRDYGVPLLEGKGEIRAFFEGSYLYNFVKLCNSIYNQSSTCGNGR